MLQQALIYLLAAAIFVPLATRMGLGSVLGYLVAGVVIGPVLGLVGSETVELQHFAEFGVVMMLFLVGLELQPKMLWKMRNKLLGLGGLQVGITMAAVTGAAMLMGQYWSVALALGMMFALSSTAIVLQSLNEKGWMKTPGGDSSFSVLLFQDIAVIPMLALMPLLAMPELMGQSTSGGAHGSAGAQGASGAMTLLDHLPPYLRSVATIAAVAAVILFGKFLVNPILHAISRTKLREMFTATALLIVIGIAVLMTQVGLSPALGTFLAGVVLADSEFRHELESDIDPFKGLLLGLFFITVGAGINFGMLSQEWGLVLALSLGLMVLKAIILYVLSLIFGIPSPDKWLFTLCLAQAGEFAFVLLGFATQNAVLPIELSERLNLVVAITMFLTPALFIFYDRVVLARSVEGTEQKEDTIDEEAPIIIAGQGRFGQIVNRMLLSNGHKTVVLDHRSDQIANLSKFGVKTYFGDASRPDLLHAAGLHSAKLVVIAIDDMHKAVEMTKHVRRERPDVHIVSRARERTDVYKLYAAGANDMIRESFDSAVRAGRSALEALGAHPHEAQKSADVFIEIDREMLLKMAEFYDEDIPISENKPFVEEAKKQLAVLDAAMEGKRTEFQERAQRGWTSLSRGLEKDK